MDIKINNQQIEKVVTPGKYGELTKKEFNQKLKIDSIINKQTNAKTFKSYLIACIKLARFEKNLEVALLLEELLRKLNNYEKVAISRLKSWKGKSSLSIIKRPDRIIVITYQKKDQDSKPLEVKNEISKEELNNVILALNRFTKGEKIHTKALAEQFCRIADITFDNERRPLFSNNKFIWKNFFAWRFMHIKFNLMLRVLDKEGVIKYRGAQSEILDSLSIQEILNI